jgi:hypothetical protein
MHQCQGGVVDYSTPARHSALVEYAIWKAMWTRRINTPANNRQGTSLGIAKNKLICLVAPRSTKSPRGAALLYLLG